MTGITSQPMTLGARISALQTFATAPTPVSADVVQSASAAVERFGCLMGYNALDDTVTITYLDTEIDAVDAAESVEEIADRFLIAPTVTSIPRRVRLPSHLKHAVHMSLAFTFVSLPSPIVAAYDEEVLPLNLNFPSLAECGFITHDGAQVFLEEMRKHAKRDLDCLNFTRIHRVMRGKRSESKFDAYVAYMAAVNFSLVFLLAAASISPFLLPIGVLASLRSAKYFVDGVIDRAIDVHVPEGMAVDTYREMLEEICFGEVPEQLRELKKMRRRFWRLLWVA